MKTVYVCGDSFASTDHDYPGMSWTEQLNATVVNLSRVAGSNLLISLQVDQAIVNQPDYIICLFTGVTRNEIRFSDVPVNPNLIERFYNYADPNTKTDLVSYSIPTMEYGPFNKKQLSILKDYHLNFLDLDLLIYKNKCIIESVLQRLVDSKIPFTFDQGGFEHKSFSAKTDYFKKFDNYRSIHNLWDYAPKRNLRPYFHIDNSTIHKMIAEYYNNKINDKT
jgi:hypothetical protein